MIIKCKNCKKEVILKDIFLLTKTHFICHMCGFDNNFFKQKSITLLNVLNNILCLMPMVTSFYYFKTINIIIAVIVSILIGLLFLIILFPLYKLIFLFIYNK